MSVVQRIGGTKTVKLAIASLLSVAVALLTGQMEYVEAAQTAVGIVMVVFLRDGVAKKDQ